MRRVRPLEFDHGGRLDAIRREPEGESILVVENGQFRLLPRRQRPPAHRLAEREPCLSMRFILWVDEFGDLMLGCEQCTVQPGSPDSLGVDYPSGCLIEVGVPAVSIKHLG